MGQTRCNNPQWQPGFDIAGPSDRYASTIWNPPNDGRDTPILVVAGLTSYFQYESGKNLYCFDETDSVWSSISGEFDGTVYALGVLPDQRLVIAGDFQHIDTKPFGGIATWDGLSWNALGGGVDGVIRDLAVSESGDLYIAGDFHSAGGTAVSHIARWDGVRWNPVGDSLYPADAICLTPEGDVYIVSSSVARLNGNRWEPISSGILGLIYTLTNLPDGSLVVGGIFSSIGNANDTPAVRVRNVARWDGKDWSKLGDGLYNEVYDLHVGSDGMLYAGGNLSIDGFGPSDGEGVARWNGSDWERPGDGVAGIARSLMTLPNGDLIASGSFYPYPGTHAPGVLRWNGERWSSLSDGINGIVTSIDTRQTGEIVVGGSFTSFGPARSAYVAYFDGNAWQNLGEGLGSLVNTVKFMPNGDIVGGGTGHTIALWSNGSWSPLGTGWQEVNAVLDLPNGQIVAAGEYNPTASQRFQIATWNGDRWDPLPEIPFSKVYDIDLTLTGEIVAAGSGGVYLWDGTNWRTLSGDRAIYVRCLRTLQNGEIAIGGMFDFIDGVKVHNIAIWNGTEWRSVGQGTNNTVRAIDELPNGQLIVGGDFTSAGGIPVNFIAKWDGNQWTSLGNGLQALGTLPSNIVYSVSVGANGSIFAGGRFSRAGDQNSIGFAQYGCSTPPCLPDTNHDGVLSPADFTAWIAASNAQGVECDQNGDGSCSPADFTAWIANFNAGCD